MSSDENNNYELYSTEGTSPLEDPDSIPPFEMEETTADTLEEYDPSEDDDGDGGGSNNNNRIFMIALGVLAGVFIISIIGMILLSQLVVPRQQAKSTEAALATLMGNEQTVQAATQTGESYAHAAELTRIAVETTPTVELVETNTPVPPTETVIAPTEAVVEATEVTVEETPQVTATNEAQQQTLEALQTRVASSPTPTEEGAVGEAQATLNPAQLTATVVAAGGSGGAGTDPGTEGEDALPDTGLLDGVLYTAIAAIVLIGVIIGARKLRKA